MPQFDASIIIVSWNVRESLRRCLTSIFQWTSGIAFDVWVTDNASEDGSADMVASEFPQVHLIRNSVNQGFARANNQAMRQSHANLFVILNPDTEFHDHSLASLVAWLNGTPDIGVAGGLLLHPDGQIQPSVRRFPTFASHALMLLKAHVLFPALGPIAAYTAQDLDERKQCDVDQVKGAFFLITRKAIEAVGLFDERFWIWFEEVDYCRRVKNAGLRVVHVPWASVIHGQGKSFRQVSHIKNQWRMNRSMRRYFWKHHSPLAALGITLLQPFTLFLALMASLVSRTRREKRGIHY